MNPGLVCPSSPLSRVNIGCPVCGWVNADAFHVILHMQSELKRLRQKLEAYEKGRDSGEKRGKQKATVEPRPVRPPVPVFSGG